MRVARTLRGPVRRDSGRGLFGSPKYVPKHADRTRWVECYLEVYGLGSLLFDVGGVYCFFAGLGWYLTNRY